MKRVLVILVVALVALAGMGAAAPGAEPPLATIAPGVMVGGIDVGGKTSERARARIARSYSHTLDLRIGDRSWRASPGWLGARAVDDSVTRALRAAPRATVPIDVSITGNAVQKYVDHLAEQVDVAPVDAKLMGLRIDKPSIAGGTNGQQLDKPAAVRAIRRQLRRDTRGPLRLPLVTVYPKVKKSDLGKIIVVERSSNRLLLYNGDKLVRTFPVATGQAIYPTPLGKWHIVVMQRDPWWYPPNDPWAAGAKPIPPGPGNPLGTRWMGLDVSGVGIHGTPEDASIGYSESHGCIRMHIPDAEWVFDHVTVGTPVFIIPI
jgi:lipoprotein-anchoring transpeptidase ErfK/SrfK